MRPAIAIVGMACRYPDARSPIELWENVLAQRRAFRRLPPERVRVEDYLSQDRDAPDCTYAIEAALIEGYDFDRERYRVAAGTFRAADLVHWLALDVASIALTDAGFPEGQDLPREAAGVLVGNTLTGEFSRANALRLRWPYVRRTVEAALAHEGWAVEQRHEFLHKLEQQYKAPFPAVSDETLAGGLSNTIAGRICNHFDLKGGGYTVDGACASSLLAVITACASLVTGDLDVALAGGVDLSLDPFELVGFAKAGALAPEEMRVYDTRSAGFWPGEGCGMVVLMREEDAARQGRRIYAVIRGWGVSSDGSGGITRPEAEGQRLAIDRAYRRTECGIDSITYFEGHGTGTSVGDATELQVLSRARRAANSQSPKAAIGSIKANIGHTKAAAGIAGLIKATMALQTQILPPTTGCDVPHAELTSDVSALRALRKAEAWPHDQPLRAAVSAMGFGGINTHVVLEGAATQRRTALTNSEQACLSSTQDAELFVFEAAAAEELRRQVDHLLTLAERISRAELSDLAAELQRIRVPGPIRAAIVASTPIELAHRLTTLQSWLQQSISAQVNPEKGVFLGAGTAQPRIGFLFPGQGSPAHLSGGAWRRGFDCVCDLYTHTTLASRSDGIATEIAQPAIVTASMAALRVLTTLGVTGSVAVGHSLGELTALHWAGAMDEATLLRIATARGKAMVELGSATGAMASIGADQQEVKELLNGGTVVIAGLNTPLQTVVSGEASAIADVIVRAQARGLKAVRLPVSHAFHSALVAAAVPVFATRLAREVFQPLQRLVVSTVTGTRLAPDEDLVRLLQHQVTFPVRCVEAVRE
ncbi:MAG: type I polyketide synthase, partial [Nitrospirales bacterium]|nr:type I polyketide synthase [Nitrospirales bacterium]